MQLTKGQKDALVRKVMTIVEAKKEAKREELRKDYKPSKEAQDLISRFKRFFEARKQFYYIVKELGFRVEYSYVKTGEDDLYDIAVNFNDKKITFADVENKIKERDLGSMYNHMYSYPDAQSVFDELELQNLSKSFDVDAFMKKYEEL